MRKSILAASVLALCAGSAHATTYVSTRNVGDATAQLSITTDDTIGVLAKGNILDWTITLTRGARTTTLFGPGDDNSIVDISGNALTASATQLSFDFGGADNSYVLFMNTDGSDISTFRSLWTIQTSGSFTSFRDPKEVIRFAFLPDGDPYITEAARSGVVAFASVVGAGPVPEPATWAMMIAGFGLAGAATRRARRSVSFA